MVLGLQSGFLSPLTCNRTPFQYILEHVSSKPNISKNVIFNVAFNIIKAAYGAEQEIVNVIRFVYEMRPA